MGIGHGFIVSLHECDIIGTQNIVMPSARVIYGFMFENEGKIHERKAVSRQKPRNGRSRTFGDIVPLSLNFVTAVHIPSTAKYCRTIGEL